jgi:hypothetical protein
MSKTIQAEWKCNTPSFIKEMIDGNPHAAILSVPAQIFMGLLGKVADRASELNDPKMNHLMCKLALYEVCDPYNPDYSQKIVDEIKEKAKNA